MLDFELSEDQDELRKLTRSILEGQVTRELLRQVDSTAERFDHQTWRALADANILGISLPEDLGGSGYGVVEECIVLQEVGRTLAPVPVWASCVLGAQTLATFGSPEQRTRWVPPAIAGDAVLSAALNEPESHWGDVLRTVAAPDGSGWRLTGVKTRVPAGTVASAVVVPALVGAGVALFLVEGTASGLTVGLQRTTTGDADGRLELDDVWVGASSVIGSVGDGPAILEWLLRRAQVGVCALQVGVCERALELTVEHTKTRKQFDRPIATFQAVAHRAADCFIDLEAMALTMQQAAYQLDSGMDAGLAVDVAKFWSSEGGQRIVHAAVHLHGGFGTDRDGAMHRYFLAGKQLEFMLGGATEHLLSLGDGLRAMAASSPETLDA